MTVFHWRLNQRVLSLNEQRILICLLTLEKIKPSPRPQAEVSVRPDVHLLTSFGGERSESPKRRQKANQQFYFLFFFRSHFLFLSPLKVHTTQNGCFSRLWDTLL